MNLLLIAHGSRDPRYAEAFETLCERLRREGHRARVGHLGLCGPDPAEAAALLAADLAAAGVRPGEEMIAAVPMFLNQGYHVTQDVPAAVMTARAAVVSRAAVVLAAHLGFDPLIAEALDSRLRELGVWPGDPDTAVVLASAGTSDRSARAVLEQAAACWEGTGWHSVTSAYAAAGGGGDGRLGVADAVAAARARGAAGVVIAGLFLAPGLLADRVALSAPGVAMSAPLLTPQCAEPALVRLVLLRARAALAAPSAPSGPPRTPGSARKPGAPGLPGGTGTPGGTGAAGGPAARADQGTAAHGRAGRPRPAGRSGSALHR